MVSAMPEALSVDASALSPGARAVVTRAVAAAPLLCGAAPRGVQVVQGAFELWADVRQWRPASEAADRGLRLAGGAALFNLRLAVATLGRRPVTVLLPFPERPEVLAVVRMAERAAPPPGWCRLYEVLTGLGVRRARHQGPAPVAMRPALRRAAEMEGGWLTVLDPGASDDRLRELIEWRCTEWPGLRVGAPAPRERRGGVIGVLSSFHDLPVGQVRAGEALQRVALTAAAYGSPTSFAPAALANPAMRADLGRRLGHHLCPQLVLRFGSPATETRPGGFVGAGRVAGGPGPDHGDGAGGV
ncbi:hypothetical protein [Pseudonocardia acaciae]|uniref:hypothetical protein n=1 Tax=Pseudonocardia acaciae TaxID=551276 RepID=UPI0004918157|nr:hypothetical protein [Pseudonocardia acaciae]